MRKFKFITTLRFIEIIGTIENSFSLMPGIDLITNRKQIKTYVNAELKSVAGIIEYQHLLNANHILICDADETIFPAASNSNEALVTWLMWLDMLINDSWLVKDNGIACEVAFSKMTAKSHTEWSSNYLSHSPSLSGGQQYQTVTFNLEELRRWESLSYQVQSFLHSKKSGSLSSFVNKEFSRIGRSMRFVAAARREKYPPIKISHYCSAFESLFSTDNAELSHKLSERVALFLKSFGFDALKVFDDMKAFYNVRSKVTHGDSIQSSKEAEIPELSQKCDTYLREIINLIIREESLIQLFDGGKNIFEDHFKRQLFS